MINYDELINLLQNQFNSIGFEYDTKIEVANSQYFVKKENLESQKIYIVIKFSEASINFGQTVLPFTINAISECNNLTICQNVLLDFAQTYNLTLDPTGNIKQAYTTPSLSSNFNDIYSGFRSVFISSGTFLISYKNNTYDIFYNNEMLDVISSGFSFDLQSDIQPYFNQRNFTKSINKFGTLTLTLVTYLTDIPVINDTLDIVTKKNTINKDFNFSLTFKNGKTFTDNFKLISIDVKKEVVNLPIITMVFTR